jgi:hypothetical protein
MHTPRIAAVATVAAVTGLATSGATASASPVKLWQNPTGKVTCGIMIHPAHTQATEVLCSAHAIPAPAHSNPSQGDAGFVEIAKTGKPKLLRLSQDSFIGKTPVKLTKGTTWTSLGVTCAIGAKSVICTNGSSHGFFIYGQVPFKSF